MANYGTALFDGRKPSGVTIKSGSLSPGSAAGGYVPQGTIDRVGGPLVKHPSPTKEGK
jgi:hypothetical protein